MFCFSLKNLNLHSTERWRVERKIHSNRQTPPPQNRGCLAFLWQRPCAMDWFNEPSPPRCLRGLGPGEREVWGMRGTAQSCALLIRRDCQIVFLPLVQIKSGYCFGHSHLTSCGRTKHERSRMVCAEEVVVRGETQREAVWDTAMRVLQKLYTETSPGDESVWL